MPADVDLRTVVEAWPVLPDVIKAGILAMVNAAKDGTNEATARDVVAPRTGHLPACGQFSTSLSHSRIKSVQRGEVGIFSTLE